VSFPQWKIFSTFFIHPQAALEDATLYSQKNVFTDVAQPTGSVAASS
jgi:hypothetical protein